MGLDGPLLYYGGKKGCASAIIEHFPRNARMYVEPFFGGGGVFFQVPQQLYPIQVINDLNKSVITFYRVLRSRPDDLALVCSRTPFAVEEQRACRSTSADEGLDELEVARRVWVRGRQNFGGSQAPGTGWSRPGPGHSQTARIESELANLQRYADRLRTVHIDCAPAAEIVTLYAKPEVFIYEDPPYHMESRAPGDAYHHEMTEAQHLELFEANDQASKAGVKIAVSGYGGPFYDRVYADWRRLEFPRRNFVASDSGEQAVKTEVLWVNYPESEEIGTDWKRVIAKGKTQQEKAILATLRAKGRVR